MKAVEKTPTSGVKRAGSPHVPEQYRGFALQPTRMASLLLDADKGSLVSLELIDDVGVENQDGTKLASQTKSARKTNPVADSSPALWKTLANWTRDVRSGAIDPTRTEFELYVNRQVSGELVKSFHELQTKQQAATVFETAREWFWGKAPEFPNRPKVAKTLAPHLDEVFGPGADAFKSILPRFRLVCAIQSPTMDLHDRVEQFPIPEHVVTDVVCHIHGWLKIRVDEQLAKGKAPIIERDEFWRELRAYVGRVAPARSLPDLAAQKPTADQLMPLMQMVFVRQLRLIDLDRESLMHAMTCFFKAGRVRTLWGEKCLVHEQSLMDLKDNLMQVWRDHRTEVFSDPLRTDELLRGKLLYAHCDRHRCTVEQKEVPEYFIPGCFHTLADDQTLGWHPRYSELLARPVA